jgi:alpha-tubulin suppressor-like RCC1 family protein
VLWQVRAGGGTITPAASTSSATGLTSVVWTLGTTLGANKAVAILQGNYVLDSAVFTATAGVGPASRLTLVAGDVQTGRVAAQLAQQLTVNVKDQYGYALSGKKVVWAAGNLSGTVTPVNTDTTDASGNASANWVLGTNAFVTQTASATIAGLAPINFTATATPDTSRVLTLVAGSGQTATAGATLGTQLQVSVADRFGNPIANDTVVFNDSLTVGGSVSPVTVATDANGRASSTWTLGNRLGAQVARARVRPTIKATFTATATAQFAQVYAGNYFTCGVTTGDRAFCWGFGEDGQRGVGAVKSSNAPAAAVTTGDTVVGPFQTWRQIGAGSSYICGISIARQLYCWGRLASAVQVSVPTLKVFSGSVLSFSGVSTAETHSCAISTDGQIGCTGSNARGQLGDGTHGDQPSDYAVVTTVAPNARLPWSMVVAGGSHTCAFPRFNPTDSANTLRPWCWGANGSGQLGNRTASIDSTIPRGIDMTGLTMVWDTTSLVAGSAHTCALDRSGAAYCWGANGYGQLGGGSTLVRDSMPMAVAGGLTFSKLYAGEYHTCGITTTGAAYCWGRNSSGQLGDGTTTKSSVPVLVSGGQGWRSLALGELHTCGVASPSGANSGTQAGAGVIYCWGDNEYGQLGIGSYGANGVPVLIPQRIINQP